jgi:hypothetical protein
MPGNKAIHQEPFASNRVAGDVFMIDRGPDTIKLDESALPQTLYTAQVTIPAADVLTLNGTPVQVIPAADAGTVYFIRGGIIQFDNGSADYATNTNAALIGTTTPGSTIYSASIANRAIVPMFVPQGGGMVPGDSISITVTGGNPATGDSDLTVTVFYYIMPV